MDKIQLKQWWNNDCSYLYMPEFIRAEEIIRKLFKDKIINWNIYDLALEKIQRVKDRFIRK